METRASAANVERGMAKKMWHRTSKGQVGRGESDLDTLAFVS